MKLKSLVLILLIAFPVLAQTKLDTLIDKSYQIQQRSMDLNNRSHLTPPSELFKPDTVPPTPTPAFHGSSQMAELMREVHDNTSKISKLETTLELQLKTSSSQLDHMTKMKQWSDLLLLWITILTGISGLVGGIWGWKSREKLINTFHSKKVG